MFSLLPCDTCQLFECIYSFHVRCSAEILRLLKWSWDGFMMTMGGWTHMLSLLCSTLGGTHEWQPIPLGSLVGYNAHTLASLVMVRWKRNTVAIGKTFRFQVKPWIWWMNTVTNIPYGKKAWTINAAAGRDKGHAMYVNALPQIPFQYDQLLSSSPTDLACTISKSLFIFRKISLCYSCASVRINTGTYLLWQSATSWDSKDS